MYNSLLEGGCENEISLQKGQSIFNKYIGFFILTVIFLWMKTYIAQLTQFDLGIENTMQKFLLFLNPLGSSLLIFRIWISI